MGFHFDSDRGRSREERERIAVEPFGVTFQSPDNGCVVVLTWGGPGTRPKIEAEDGMEEYHDADALKAAVTWAFLRYAYATADEVLDALHAEANGLLTASDLDFFEHCL